MLNTLPGMWWSSCPFCLSPIEEIEISFLEASEKKLTLQRKILWVTPSSSRMVNCIVQILCAGFVPVIPLMLMLETDVGLVLKKDRDEKIWCFVQLSTPNGMLPVLKLCFVWPSDAMELLLRVIISENSMLTTLSAWMVRWGDRRTGSVYTWYESYCGIYWWMESYVS